jgi:hypothetical protein
MYVCVCVYGRENPQSDQSPSPPFSTHARAFPPPPQPPLFIHTIIATYTAGVVAPPPRPRQVQVEGAHEAEDHERQQAADADADGQFSRHVEPAPGEIGEGEREGGDEEGPGEGVGEVGIEGGKVVCWWGGEDLVDEIRRGGRGSCVVEVCGGFGGMVEWLTRQVQQSKGVRSNVQLNICLFVAHAPAKSTG